MTSNVYYNLIVGYE